MKWIKLWTEITWNADIRQLTATQRWVFITLLCLAAKMGGFIRGNYKNSEHLALASGTDVRTINNTVPILQQLCLINVADNGDIEIPNWHKYQSTTDSRREREERQNAALEEEKNRIDKNRREEEEKTADIYLTNDQDKALNEWLKIPCTKKPDRNGIAEQLLTLWTEFPAVDFLSLAKTCRDWHNGKNKKCGNLALTMRNWAKRAVKYESDLLPAGKEFSGYNQETGETIEDGDEEFEVRGVKYRVIDGVTKVVRSAK